MTKNLGFDFSKIKKKLVLRNLSLSSTRSGYLEKLSNHQLSSDRSTTPPPEKERSYKQPKVGSHNQPPLYKNDPKRFFEA